MGKKAGESITIDHLSKAPIVDISKFVLPEENNEELNSFSHDILIEFLDYSEKGELVPDEVLEKEREAFKWLKHGPKAWHLKDKKPSGPKLTSPEVFFILTSTHTSEQIAERFNIEKHYVKMLRRGEAKGWEWEYALVRKIMRIVKNRGLNLPRTQKRKAFLVFKVDKDTKEREILHVCLSERTANKVRKDMLYTRDYEKFIKSGNLDVWYPIVPFVIS